MAKVPDKQILSPSEMCKFKLQILKLKMCTASNSLQFYDDIKFLSHWKHMCDGWEQEVQFSADGIYCVSLWSPEKNWQLTLDFYFTTWKIWFPLSFTWFIKIFLELIQFVRSFTLEKSKMKVIALRIWGFGLSLFSDCKAVSRDI